MKKDFLAVFAIFLVIALSAFTTSNEIKPSFDQEFWFDYNGGGIGNPNNYSLTSGTGENPPACNEPSGVRCAILTEMDGAGPNLSTYSEERLKASQ